MHLNKMLHFLATMSSNIPHVIFADINCCMNKDVLTADVCIKYTLPPHNKIIYSKTDCLLICLSMF